MDIENLRNQLDYAQARIEELDKIIINAEQTTKGYKEVIDVYNKWTDTYNDILSKIEHFNDVSLDEQKLELEKEKLNIEKSKIEIEQDKINNETERIRLEREKFANEIEMQKRNEIEDIIFKTLDIGTKVSVPVIGGYFAMKLAVLAYTKNGELELRDGTIWALIRQLKM